MAATRYEPWDVISQLQGQISRIFEKTPWTIFCSRPLCDVSWSTRRERMCW